MVLWCYTMEGALMAYFLKKSNLKKGVYLQIYESFYNPSKNHLCLGAATISLLVCKKL